MIDSAAAPATLLIVDDTPDNIAVLFDYLLENQFKVLVCESGEAALGTLAVEEPDLILLDVMMPGLDGFETCRRIKTLPAGQDVPVFFMTARDAPYDKVRGLNAGAVDYITKPVYPEEVLARIQTHLEIRRLQKNLQEQNDRLDAALQRSINAEHALQGLLDQAIVLVDSATHGIQFVTTQAGTLIEAIGGPAAFLRQLAAGTTVFGLADGRRVIAERGATSTINHAAIVSLRFETPPPSPESLRPLGLTPRESEILFWIAHGKTNPEIAIILGMQTCTVKKHVENFLPKLGVESRLAAALRANEILKGT